MNDLDNELHFMILKAFQNSNRLIMREVNEIGLLSGQPKVLEYLRENDGAKSIDIACGCALDKSTVAGLIRRMEKMDLIKRVCNKEDRRAYNTFLTEHGKDMAEEVKKIAKEVDSLAMKNFSKEEIKDFLLKFSRIIKNLESLV